MTEEQLPPVVHQSSHRAPAPGELDLVRRFINTADLEDGRDEFSTPAGLRRFLLTYELIAEDDPITGADVQRAVEVREGLRALCLANNGEEIGSAAVAGLNAAAGGAPLVARFDEYGGGQLLPAGGALSGVLARIFSIVTAAMVEGTWKRLKACPAHDCMWAFYDRSRNRSSTWCDMAVCGNRAKARTYRERKRGAA